MALPSFTVVIPTKQRADTLRYALQTVLSQDYDRLSVVVSDNASTDGTRDVVESVRDPRVQYVNTGRRLGMSENFEFALGHARGEWVCVIGDDDGLMPGALRYAAETVQETGCLGLSSAFSFYLWPDARREGAEPYLVVPVGTGFEVRDARTWLGRVLDGLVGHSELPSAYTGGFISAELVARGRRDGRFFRARIPDVYSAVLAGRILDRYVRVHEPLIVNGTSRHSCGDSTFGASARSAPAREFEAETGIDFHPWIGPGKVPPMPLIIYDCLLRSCEVCGPDDLAPDPVAHLALAWRVSDDKERILEIAARHGIERSVIELASRRRAPRDLAWYRRTLRAWATNREINGAYGATNVHEAALVASTVVHESRERPMLRSTRALLGQVTSRLQGRG